MHTEMDPRRLTEIISTTAW